MSAYLTWQRWPKLNAYAHARLWIWTSMLGAATVGEEARLLRCSATTYEPHLQRADVRLLYDRFDRRALAERLVADFAGHVYFPAELELLFVSTGFKIAQQYADYRLMPCRPHVAICRDRSRRPRRSARRPCRTIHSQDRP